MAVINSLVCWGGRTGKTVSLSATTDVVTLTNHGLRNGTKLWPSGTLPAELSVLVPVYARSTGVNTFTLHTSSADAIANTGQILFAGSSTYAAVVLKSDLVANAASALAPYGLSDLSRWGASGSERIYDSVRNALSAQESATGYTDEIVIECGEALTEYVAWNATNSGKAVSMVIESRINGIRSGAFHDGIPGNGLICHHIGTSASTWYYPNNKYLTIDGITFIREMSTVTTATPILSSCYVFINNLLANVGAEAQAGIVVNSETLVANNVVYGGTYTYGGIALASSGSSATVAHNTVSKCSKGFGAIAGAGASYVYNNLAVGNTANWLGGHTYGSSRAYGNIGDTTDKTAFTNTAASTVLTLAVAPRFNSNQQVMVSSSGTLPAPLNDTTTYFVRTIAGNTITLSTSYGGGNITLTNTGSGTHSISFVWGSMGQVENHIDFSDPALVFKDWTNNDFRPAGTGATPAAQALMVDTAKTLALLNIETDIVGNERPQYRNGRAEYKDVGAFEYDFGFTRPASHVLTLENVVVGSRVVIRDQAKTIVHFEQVAASSTVTATVTVYGDARDNWLIDVRQGSTYPYYQRYKTFMTATPGASSLFINQLPDQR